jgi:hypothetical protein
MKVPTYLKHEPVFGIEGYNKMDGIYAGRGTDAPCLSIRGCSMESKRQPRHICKSLEK